MKRMKASWIKPGQDLSEINRSFCIWKCALLYGGASGRRISRNPNLSSISVSAKSLHSPSSNFRGMYPINMHNSGLQTMRRLPTMHNTKPPGGRFCLDHIIRLLLAFGWFHSFYRMRWVWSDHGCSSISPPFHPLETPVTRYNYPYLHPDPARGINWLHQRDPRFCRSSQDILFCNPHRDPKCRDA